MINIESLGLFGLFVMSAIGSTVFVPFSVEVTLALLAVTSINPIALILVATVGSLIGSAVNYGIGLYLFDWFENKFSSYKKDIDKAKAFSDKHGAVGLFFVLALPVSLPVDFLTMFAGVCKMRTYKFLFIVFSGKLVKYTTVMLILMNVKTVLF